MNKLHLKSRLVISRCIGITPLSQVGWRMPTVIGILLAIGLLAIYGYTITELEQLKNGSHPVYHE